MNYRWIPKIGLMFWIEKQNCQKMEISHNFFSDLFLYGKDELLGSQPLCNLGSPEKHMLTSHRRNQSLKPVNQPSNLTRRRNFEVIWEWRYVSDCFIWDEVEILWRKSHLASSAGGTRTWTCRKLKSLSCLSPKYNGHLYTWTLYGQFQTTSVQSQLANQLHPFWNFQVLGKLVTS